MNNYNDDNDDRLTLSLNSFHYTTEDHLPPSISLPPPQSPSDAVTSSPSPPPAPATTVTLQLMDNSHLFPLELSLAPPPFSSSSSSPPSFPSLELQRVVSHSQSFDAGSSVPSSGPSTRRRNPRQAPRRGRNEEITPAFPWSTNRRAHVHTLEYLRAHQIHTIHGDVRCRSCDSQYRIEYDLWQRFNQVGSLVAQYKDVMRDRAPDEWEAPALPTCRYCQQEKSVKPVMAQKKREINWLFLLLGQMIGCCTLEQLKYFCKHTRNHRTGAKNRLVFLTYLTLCRQLLPDGPFDLW